MRIKTIRIKNYRAFVDETIPLDEYTTLLGENGAGKSTILSALNIFFGERSNPTDVQTLTKEDFYQKNVEEPVRITLTFHQLSPAAVADLSHYVRQGELVVSAVAEFDKAKANAPVRQVGARLGMKAFAPFFSKQTKMEARKFYDDELRTKYGLKAGKSFEECRRVLHEYEQEHKDQLEELESSDEFYGYAGASRLGPFVQWVYIPATNQALEEQSESGDNALKRLLARTVRTKVNFSAQLDHLRRETGNRYQEIMQEAQGVLDEVSKSLSARLQHWAHPAANLSLFWEHQTNYGLREPNAHVAGEEEGFAGDLARFGHGFQRSYVMALLHELSATDTLDGPTLILGCEEPELYQHPPQARHLAGALQTLVDRNAQVVLTTHSPYFVSGRNLESVRMIRRAGPGGSAKVFIPSFDEYARVYAEGKGKPPAKPEGIAALLQDVLRPQICEMFFARTIVLVEGSEDVAYLMTWLTLTNRLDEFRKLRIHIIPVDGKSELARPLVLAKTLSVPYFLMFDADGDCEAKHKDFHRVDNELLWKLLEQHDQKTFPEQAVWGERFVVWPTQLATIVTAEIEQLLGNEKYRKALEHAQGVCGHTQGMKKKSVYIEALLSQCVEQEIRPPSLDKLVEAVLGAPGPSCSR